MRGHKSTIDVVQILSDDYMVSGSQDGKVCLWKESKKSPANSFENAHGLHGCAPRWITSLATIKGSNTFASGSYDGTVKIWTVKEETIQLSGTLDVPGCVNALAMSNRLIVAASGREPRLGRWITLPSRNHLAIFRLNQLE
jgi:ribosomal RNA-processing protein 9